MDAMPLESLTLQDSSTNESFKSRKCVACSKSEVLFFTLCSSGDVCQLQQEERFYGYVPVLQSPDRRKNLYLWVEHVNAAWLIVKILGELTECGVGGTSRTVHASLFANQVNFLQLCFYDKVKKLEARLEENVSKLVAAFKKEMVESSTNSTCLLDSFQINEPKRTCDCMDEEDESYLSLVEAGLNFDLDHPKNHSITSAVSYTRELREKLKERKEWANYNKKFVQVDQRLSYILVELKFLRLERSVKERTNVPG
ncbi:hypothetical protein LguiB_020974 [Lonicera macranthoides]